MSGAISSHSWLKFFKDAGIPADLSARYAVMFMDHRIQKDMLADLDRDILSDVGIKAVGDKMAIMKHARFIAEQAKRDASSKQLADGIKTLESRSSKNSSPAERMINHSINSRSPSGRNSPKILTKESPKIEKDMNKKEKEEPSKSTVFDRLGRNSSANSPSKPAGVFTRLGANPTENSELQYAGVLKKPASPITPPKKTVLVPEKAKTTSVLDRLGAEKPETPISTTQGTKKQTAVARKTGVIKKVIIKKKPITGPSKLVLPPSRTLPLKINTRTTSASTPKKKSNVLDRLGDIVVTSTTKPAAEDTTARKSPPTKRKLIVIAPKKGTEVAVKRRSTDNVKTSTVIATKRRSIDDLNKSPVIAAKRPISSNMVSSTSAGLFRRGAKPTSSVFDRLGAK